MSPVGSHWSASWPALILYLLLAGAHLTGLGRLLAAGEAPAGRRTMIREALIFQGGLLLALLAIASPFGYEARVFIWVRALQDLTLAFVAPGLIVLGAPWPALARCAGRVLAAPPDARRPPWWLRWPVATAVAFNVVWLAWHLPVLFDQVQRGGVVAAAEYALFLGVGHPVLAAADRLAAVDPGRAAAAAGGAADRHRGRRHRAGHGAGLRLGRGLPRVTPTRPITC